MHTSAGGSNRVIPPHQRSRPLEHPAQVPLIVWRRVLPLLQRCAGSDAGRQPLRLGHSGNASCCSSSCHAQPTPLLQSNRHNTSSTTHCLSNSGLVLTARWSARAKLQCGLLVPARAHPGTRLEIGRRARLHFRLVLCGFLPRGAGPPPPSAPRRLAFPLHAAFLCRRQRRCGACSPASGPATQARTCRQ